MAQVLRYEFSYTTPSLSDAPTSFMLGGISEDVAKGIRFGLRKVTSITNVVVSRVFEDRDALSSGDPV